MPFLDLDLRPLAGLAPCDAAARLAACAAALPWHPAKAAALDALSAVAEDAGAGANGLEAALAPLWAWEELADRDVA